jgi:hypothetical protein
MTTFECKRTRYHNAEARNGAQWSKKSLTVDGGCNWLGVRRDGEAPAVINLSSFLNKLGARN